MGDPVMRIISSAAVVLVALTIATPAAADAQATPGQAEQIIMAPLDVKWTSVKSDAWKAEAAKLVGKYVEVANAGMFSQLMVSRTSSFGNNGWLNDSTGKQVGTVLYDQLSDDGIQWLRKTKCAEKCQGVFVRGMVVKRGNGFALRMIDASFDSRAGLAAVGAAALNIAAADPDAKKPLLPSGGVPNNDGTGPWGGEMASSAAALPTRDTAKKGGLMGKLKAAGVTVKVGKDAAPAKAQKPGTFPYGDLRIVDTYYRNIRDTELKGLFANAPWNAGRTMWPRVALIIEEKPQGHSPSVTYMKWGQDIVNGCWRIRARIWTSPAANKEVKPFNWCLTEMKVDTMEAPGTPPTKMITVAVTGLPEWAKSPKTMFSDQNTGPEGTEGPNPPYVPTIRFGYQMRTDSDAIMLGNVLREMGFSYGVADGRAWVVQEGRRQ
jgi:hypothetical protein